MRLSEKSYCFIEAIIKDLYTEEQKHLTLKNIEDIAGLFKSHRLSLLMPLQPPEELMRKLQSAFHCETSQEQQR
ncbi:Hypothetical predicted protein [Octopus vulgaris]|uniref:Uncharacterized protein n=1 Tax=Octopus vulgaris TaxID=6645 RepID=A0AA36BCZ1_OCTVU|nr:Hypothetical predicted protein [Octopus vulgaris]